MKKILIMLLAVVMLFTAAGCDLESIVEMIPKSEGSGSISQKDLDDLDAALEKLESLMPEGWDENKYGAYIYGVWDAEFLPDCIPAPPEGVKVDQTTFKDYDHDTLNGDYSVGPLIYETKEDYREYGVLFYATQAQLDAFIASVEAGNMTGGMTEEGDWTYYDYFGGGWFMEIFVRQSFSEDDYDYIVSVNATDSLFQLPKAISGIPLPQRGMVSWDMNKGYTIQNFTNGYEDVDFDLEKDRLPTQNYAAWFNYHCTVNQDAKDYANELKGLGWAVEWESDGENGYRCCLKKDGNYAVSNYLAYDGVLEVGFSDMVENLSY